MRTIKSNKNLAQPNLEQLYFWASTDSISKPEEVAFSEDSLSSIGLDHERKILEENYAGCFESRVDLRNLVTYVPNKSIPVYNWFKYKEGFSRELVHLLIKELSLKSDDVILDPFAGCGTTLLACKEFGYHAVGLEILPIAVYVAGVKLLDWPNLDWLSDAVEKLLSLPFKKPVSKFPDVQIVDKAFAPEVQQQILFYKDVIREFDPPVRDFLMLGLLSILEQVSYTSKDGQFLRIVDKKIPPVKKALRKQLTKMLADLRQREQFLFRQSRSAFPPERIRPADADKSGQSEVKIFEGDARELCLPHEYVGKIAGVITSPPYLNRYDYSRTYALELCTISVDSFEELRDIRHRLLRSHIESKVHRDREIKLPAIDEILQALAQKKLNNNRIPIMIQGYFEDMNLVIQNLSRYLKKDGRVALVVANAQFQGEYVPTDLILSELAKRHGLVTEKIWITRFKGNSSQQMAKYGRRPVRETIVFWRKIGGAEI
jgi:DNA modification methylase